YSFVWKPIRRLARSASTISFPTGEETITSGAGQGTCQKWERITPACMDMSGATSASWWSCSQHRVGKLSAETERQSEAIISETCLKAFQLSGSNFAFSGTPCSRGHKYEEAKRLKGESKVGGT